MNTEKTENNGIRGWIYYDAACPLCRAGRRVVGRLFARRGFQWVPLQSPEAVPRLGLPETALREEMKLQLPDGQVIGGLDSWIILFRSVWWLWLVGFLLSLPGCHALGQVGYRWIARNRYCFGGICGIARRSHPHRKIPFLDWP